MKKNLFISPETPIKEALKKLDETAEKTLFVVDEQGHLLGTVTDGDIRRFVIKTGKISGTVKDIYNKTPIILQKNNMSPEDIKRIFIEKKIEVLPIVDRDNKVVDYITWNHFLSDKERNLFPPNKKINIPVVIMAGGKGTRLQPFTHVLPKPLIPVGDKTVIEHIIDRFRKFGIHKFFITLNYKKEMIEAYFNGIKKDYEIKFIRENDFLGTAGSLKLLEDKLDESTFIVSNCDTIIEANLSEIYEFHKTNQADFTSITAILQYTIPYGIVNVRNGGVIESIEEKPEYTFQINTGVYILNKDVLDLIPKNQFLDMPDLIRKLLENGRKALAYPISESNYIDVGQWENYRKALKKLGGLSNA